LSAPRTTATAQITAICSKTLRHQYRLPSLRLLQNASQHQKRVGAASLAHDCTQIVADCFGLQAQALGDALGNALEGARQNEVVDGGGFKSGTGQSPRQNRRHNLHIAFVADPALFPLIIKGLVSTAKMIDEIHRAGSPAYPFGKHILTTHQHGRAAIAIVKFLRRDGLWHTAITCGY
jgi:hypothetical protein